MTIAEKQTTAASDASGATATTDAAEAGAAWHRWMAPAVAVLVAGMALYLGITVWSGHDRLLATLRRFPVQPYAPLVLGLVLVGWFLRALRWHYYARTLRWPVPFGPNVLAFCASFAFTATPGKAGEVVKAALLRARYGVSMADTAGVLLVERLGDVMAVLLLGIGGLALLPNGLGLFVFVLIAMGCAIAFLTTERLYGPTLRRLGTYPRFERIAAKLLQLVVTGRALLRPRPLAVGLAIAVVAWGCEALAFALILAGLGASVSTIAAFSVYAIATLVGAVTMLPGGIGGVEAAMLLLLAVLRVETGAAVASVLLIRLSTLYFVSVLGVGFMAAWWLRTSRHGGQRTRNTEAFPD
ncbi:MAG TPA: lysylphosphatidylglycerol synthase transmembrane domain-containing protein [Chloroflexota bacterium]|nr:lysylphosphatidylglycerol synthase transmembrane domain-containing protein [Chloroflexota bacterium]